MKIRGEKLEIENIDNSWKEFCQKGKQRSGVVSGNSKIKEDFLKLVIHCSLSVCGWDESSEEEPINHVGNRGNCCRNKVLELVA